MGNAGFRSAGSGVLVLSPVLTDQLWLIRFARSSQLGHACWVLFPVWVLLGGVCQVGFSELGLLGVRFTG